MPSKSIAQQHLMQAAEHGAQFPMAQKLRQSMSHDQLHDFSVGSEAGKPQHVQPALPAAPQASAALPVAPDPPPAPPAPPALQGETPSIISSNTSSFKNGGASEYDATRKAIRLAATPRIKTGHVNRHKNLGKYLHPKKGM